MFGICWRVFFFHVLAVTSYRASISSRGRFGSVDGKTVKRTFVNVFLSTTKLFRLDSVFFSTMFYYFSLVCQPKMKKDESQKMEIRFDMLPRIRCDGVSIRYDE